MPDARRKKNRSPRSADAAKGPTAGTPIVGIGASAGGIEALTRFFDALPDDTGMAFVIVLHLDPNRESQLSSLLAQHTRMPVREIVDGARIEPDCVYVIAPDAYLRVSDSTLRLTKPTEARGHRYPVDVLFESLAEDQGERAIAIVLSGTGSNGTKGLKEVKAQGGCALAQSPETAAFDAMPRSAIASGMVDHVLAPEAMPGFLLAYVRHDYMAAPAVGGPAANAGELGTILALLRTQCGQDFRDYKHGTILRRIHRRMGLRSVDALADYIELLRKEPHECEALVKDVLISVTGFFRDPEAWAALDETVLKPLIDERDEGAPVRIWIPGCATGEEPYSLCMLLVERAEAAHKRFDLKVFATDCQEHNLNVARTGVYPDAATEAIRPDRLRRFFNKLDGTYEVKKELRELVVFAAQNILHDPPFSRLDLIVCRNLLIYLSPEAQARTLTLFHFALRQDGFLFLGNAETVGRQDDLFDTVSKKARIYRRIGPTRHDIVDFPSLTFRPRTTDPAEAHLPEPAVGPGVAELARRTLLDRYAPASVLIDRKGRALWHHGATGDYLGPPPGAPTQDVVAMAREGLGAKLRGAVHEAQAKSATVTFSARLKSGGTARTVAVTVAPAPASEQTAGMLLVSFVETSEQTTSDHGAPPPAAEAADNERALEAELREVRAELDSTIEQMESANEELKASNEEITSMNEELQSTNEELETSKEELQSFNEELHTVNNQLQHKVQELTDINNDLDNLLAGTEIATVFLDAELRIKWFSPASKALLDLVSSDVGRPLAHFALKVRDESLLRDVETVLAKLTPMNADVCSEEGRWFQRRLLPYRTRDNRIDGVVLTISDITDRKAAATAVDEARRYAEAIVETVRQPLLVLDGDLRVRSANQAFYDAFGYTPDETAQRFIYDLEDGAWDIPELRRLLTEVLPHGEPFVGYQVDHSFQKLGRRILRFSGRVLSRGGGRADLILLAIEDVTAEEDAEAHREVLIAELSHRVKNMLATVQSIASQTIRQSPSLETFRTAFEGRLHALAGGHDLLVDESWTSAQIGSVVRQVVGPYDSGVVVEGPEIAVRPQVAVALTMILHELATNAAKYGALSSLGGRVDVAWRLEDAEGGKQVRLTWVESGGPTVKRPSRAGFGSMLIERSAAYELGGRAALEFRPEGVSCELIFPWRDAAPAEPMET